MTPVEALPACCWTYDERASCLTQCSPSRYRTHTQPPLCIRSSASTLYVTFDSNTLYLPTVATIVVPFASTETRIEAVVWWKRAKNFVQSWERQSDMFKRKICISNIFEPAQCMRWLPMLRLRLLTFLTALYAACACERVSTATTTNQCLTFNAR